MTHNPRIIVPVRADSPRHEIQRWIEQLYALRAVSGRDPDRVHEIDRHVARAELWLAQRLQRDALKSP